MVKIKSSLQTRIPRRGGENHSRKKIRLPKGSAGSNPVTGIINNFQQSVIMSKTYTNRQKWSAKENKLAKRKNQGKEKWARNLTFLSLQLTSPKEK